MDDIFGLSSVTFGSPLADLSGLSDETAFQFEGIHRNVEPYEVCSVSDLDHAHLKMSKVVDGVEALDSMTVLASRELENASKDSQVDFQSRREESKRGFEHARLIPTYSHSDEEDDESDDCYEDIEEIKR